MNGSGNRLNGAAKWAAVGVLGAMSAGGLAWTVLSRPSALPIRDEPRAVVQQIERSGPRSRSGESGEGLKRGEGAGVAPAASVTKKININTATEAELELLPGVGPALAARIIAHRTEHGAFSSVDRLDDVKGIGAAKLARIRPLVCVDDAR